MRRHIRILLVALLAVLGVTAIEKLWPIVPGLFVGLLELALELTALVVFLIRGRRTRWSPGQRWLLGSFLLFILVADFFYIYFYYLKGIGRPTTVVSVLTSMPYALCFISLSGFFWLSLSGHFLRLLRSPSRSYRS